MDGIRSGWGLRGNWSVGKCSFFESVLRVVLRKTALVVWLVSGQFFESFVGMVY